MKRLSTIIILSLGYTFFFYQHCSAINQKALGDSLSCYANQFQRVGKIKVVRIKVNAERADVFINKNLSYLSLDEQKITKLRKIAEKEIFGSSKGKCFIYTDGYELSELEASKLRENLHYTLPKEHHQLVENDSREYTASRGLDGFHIALYGSHGIYYNQTDRRWTFQRARLLTTVEDLYTTSYTMTFLVPMLENAGAVVLQPRERDTQLNEMIVDNTEAEQTDNNTFKLSEKNTGFSIPSEPLREGENPFTFGTYSYSQSQTDEDKTDYLLYRPNIEQAGEYAVYVSYSTLPTSTQAAEYTVMHNGIETHFKVNQKMGGGTWVYIGTFGFSTNKERNYVSVSNHGKQNTVITSDAIKFGGGMGSVARYSEPAAIENIKSSDDISISRQGAGSCDAARADGITSSFPRYIEAARYWMQYSGIPDSVYNYTQSKNDYIDDYAARGRWMNWLIGGSDAYPQGQGLGIPIHLGFCFHTDAGLTKNDSTVGTLAIYMTKDDEKRTEYPTGVSRLAGRTYADIVQTQIVEDIRSTFAPKWQRRELMNSSYAEARNPMIPTMLLELLSHQNPADMKYGLDPRFRFVVSRAIYKGMLRYLHEQYGTKYVVQPLPVKDFAVMNQGTDTLQLTWQAQTDSLEPTAKADYFIVYTRRQGYDWDNGTRTEHNYYTFLPEKDTHYDFRIVAGNKGGISFPSETLSARLGSNLKSGNECKGMVFIINGFNRVSAPDYFEQDSTFFSFTTEAVPYGKEVNYIGRQYDSDRSHPWITDDNGGFGQSYMDHADCWYMGNSLDYPALHGAALASLGMSYISSSVSAVKEIPQEVSMVDLILGKQKLTTIGTDKQLTDFPTLTPELIQVLTDYNIRGGNLLISGAYITSDKAADKNFLCRTLHLKHASACATRSGKISITIPDDSGSQAQHTAILFTEPNTWTLHCENPDGIVPTDKQAKVFARYKDSFIAAAVAVENQDTKLGRTLTFSFPLESLTDFSEVYIPAIKWLIKERQ